MNLNYEDMEKSYKDVVENNKRIEQLRMQCQNIFKENGITINIPVEKTHEDE